jgi:DNA replication and repair protein RecF
MFIFNKPVPSFSSLFSKFACFSYNSKKDMIFWNKREMWKELNYLFSVLDRDYYNILLYYNKILKHRNKLLKEGRGDEGSLGDFIKEKGKFLQEKRKIYFKEMEKRMVDFGLKVKIVYVPSLLEADYSREIEKGYTLFGIVRDRVDFYLNGLSLRYSCSEGEKRMFLFFFYRVFLDMVKEKREFSPVFVLDDFFSVMDYSMVKAYMDNWGGQVIISSLRKLEGDFNIIEIKEDG